LFFEKLKNRQFLGGAWGSAPRHPQYYQHLQLEITFKIYIILEAIKVNFYQQKLCLFIVPTLYMIVPLYFWWSGNGTELISRKKSDILPIEFKKFLGKSQIIKPGANYFLKNGKLLSAQRKYRKTATIGKSI